MIPLEQLRSLSLKACLCLGGDKTFLKREEVPSTFQEIGIKTGYRKPCCSLIDCLVSAFHGTNETLNFWTHFLPFWYFVWTLKAFCSQDHFLQDPYYWPFLAYLVTSCAWPFISCTAHLFSVLSEDVRHICFFIDYVGVAWYAMGCAVVYHAYAFDAFFFNTWYSRIFLWLAACASIFCVLVACASRFIQNDKLRKIARVFAFVTPYVITSIPLLESSFCPDASIWQHERQFFFAACSILLYSLHFPECIAPGAFDIVGHSHQLFHICGIIANYDQLWACHTDLTERRSLMADRDASPHGKFSLGITAVVLVIQLLIVAAFTCVLLKRIKKTAGQTLKNNGPKIN